MIVKDEEPQLAGCLDSVQGLVSEIIIVDTGSTDNTKKIALNYNAKIIDHLWNDDFSAPRNISLKAASYDWILILDADERLDKSDFEKIRRYTQSRNLAYKLVQRHYRNDTELVGFKLCQGEFPEWEKNWHGYVESSLIRLIPNDPQLEYRNCMHELLEESVNNLPHYKTIDSEIRLHHFDLARPSERISWKKNFYTRMSAKKAQMMNDSWKAHYEYGLDLNVKKRFTESLAPLLKAHQLDPRQLDPLLALGHAFGELKKFRESEECFLKTLKLDPKNFQAACHLGVVYMKIGKFDLAVRILQEALKLNPKDIGALLNLAEAYQNLNMPSEAKKFFLHVLNSVPDQPRALIGFAISGCALGDYADSEKALLILKKMGAEPATIAYWLSEVYRLSGRVQEAAQILSKLLEVVTDASTKQQLQKKYQSCLSAPV